MWPVSRTKILGVAVGLALALLCASAAAGSTDPRGVLTHPEYQELLAAQKAINHAGESANPNAVCRALTGLSRVTETQHSECLAALPFFDEFIKFDRAVQHCQKGKNSVTDYLCMYEVVDGLYKATVAVINTNRTATAAATERGLTGKCLDDLVLTTRQSRAMARFSTELHKFARDVMHTNVAGLQADQRPLTTALASVGKAMLDSTGTVTVCPHQ